ncbi:MULTISPECIES: TetR/AcrR family transcriptional regulator C-terminal domain-containing protein [unclassified Nocardioides]|uniref:TetR/AcrR family transcriptional regulator n=1 Tax=unclassified Nocardioides TaxID=2615069 RepID=UPI0000571D84|nr:MULTISPECIES: TetR/AcrR family transcriptional regulator C-terminal domain-containing protein [unclassified Nocardioides]ABL79517.1 regulatory protein, TetR [Nocardioides sp. JS614]
MSTQSLPASGHKASLTRARIVDRALRYIDENGLSALSMHKLGAALEVKGMSLYHHVANKDDLLDGVVEALWAEVEQAAPAGVAWREGVESLAKAVRDMVRRHPNAAPLIYSQQLMPEPALRVVQAHVRMLAVAGFDEQHAYDLLRTIWSYAFGSAFAEITWATAEPGCAVDVRQLLRPGTPEDLALVADVFCGQSDMDSQFRLGLDLMLRGVESPGPTSDKP